MATHSSILAWGIPWTEELGGLQSEGHKESDMTEQLTLSHLPCQVGPQSTTLVRNMYILKNFPTSTVF